MLSDVQQGLSSSQAAEKFDVSKRWAKKRLAKDHSGGLKATQPISKKTGTSPQRSTEAMEDRKVKLLELIAAVLDARPTSIAARLRLSRRKPPAISTIRRILDKHQLIVPPAKKRPRSGCIRFEAAQPNETWQSNLTHWKLADGTDVEISNLLDDYSRFLLGCRAYIRITADTVVERFADLVNEFGVPRSTLSDNGLVFTTRLVKGRSGFEYLLDSLGVEQKNSRPHHPQTQGKIERFHQTLKLHLAQKPRATSLWMLQQQLDYFKDRYNHDRLHKSLNGKAHAHAYAGRPKATSQDLNSLDQSRARLTRSMQPAK